MKIVSACLAGMACKYNGMNNNTQDLIVRLVEEGQAVPVCPEMLGGLSVPRTPCEICQDRVITQEGKDRTDAYQLGARRALAIAKAIDANKAILMSRSPACGVNQIYDGTFSKQLVDGDGIFTRELKKVGIEVIDVMEYVKEEKQ